MSLPFGARSFEEARRVSRAQTVNGQTILALLARTYKRDSDGKFASSGGGGASDVGDVNVMTQEEYEATYDPGDVIDESGFGDGGYVQAASGGAIQVGFRRSDGKVEVFADMDQSDAQQLADAVDWARGFEISNRGDRPPDPDNGMVDWKASPATGLIVGVRAGGDMAIAHDDGSQGFVLNRQEAADFEGALLEQIDVAADDGATS